MVLHIVMQLLLALSVNLGLFSNRMVTNKLKQGWSVFLWLILTTVQTITINTVILITTLAS